MKGSASSKIMHTIIKVENGEKEAVRTIGALADKKATGQALTYIKSMCNAGR